jgi:hypothetical protein
MIFDNGAQIVEAVHRERILALASGRPIDAARAISRTSGVKASITAGPS